MKKNRLVKSIMTKSFSVDLYELVNGEYVVQSEVFGRPQQHTKPTDLKTAMVAFDAKVQELEGN